MTTLQRLEVEASELRAKLNELAVDADADETKIAELSASYSKVEARRRAAILAEDVTERETAAETPDAEARERARLVETADIRHYVAAGLKNRALEGAEAELNAATETPDNRLPWSMLAEPEKRVDAVTDVPTDVQRRPQRTIPRVFSNSVLSFLGVEMPRVGAGEALYTHLTAGASPAPVAKGDPKDAEAGTLSAITLKPVRISAAYLYAVEDRALMAGLPEVLRRDLRAALVEEFSDLALNGTGTAPQPAGFVGSNALGTAPTDPAAVAGFSAFTSLMIDGVDGLHAYTVNGVRLLTGVSSYKLAAGSVSSDYQNDALAIMLARSGGVRATSLIEASSTIEQAVAYRAERGAGSAIFPTWEGVEIIEDRFSGASKGEVRLTLIALANFRVLRAAAYTRSKIKVSA